MSECDPDCCACRIKDALKELVEAGADVEDVIPLILVLVGEVFEVNIHDVEMVETPHDGRRLH